MELDTLIISVLTSSVIATLLGDILERRKQQRFSEQQLKETRYKIIIAKMGVHMNPKYIEQIHFEKPKTDLEPKKLIEDLRRELEMEWYNSWLFASDDVIRNLKEFIFKPDELNYGKTVLSMRKDLGFAKTQLKAEECQFPKSSS